MRARRAEREKEGGRTSAPNPCEPSYGLTVIVDSVEAGTGMIKLACEAGESEGKKQKRREREPRGGGARPSLAIPLDRRRRQAEAA